jgi:hypothetical protein
MPPRTTGFRDLRSVGNYRRAIQIFDADRVQSEYLLLANGLGAQVRLSIQWSGT